MDRQKKLILAGAGGLLLLVFILVLVVLAIRSKNRPDPEPQPTPTISAEPTATPTTVPTPTPAVPDQPELPGSIATPTATAAPTATPTPTEAGTPDLPGGTATATPKPTKAPSASPKQDTATPAFEFGLPGSAKAKSSISISVSSKNIVSASWKIVKLGSSEAETAANGSPYMQGTLNQDGGAVSFPSAGKYKLIAVAASASGKTVTVSREIEITGESATGSSGLSFGLPGNAYTDTILMVTVSEGAGPLIWSVSRDGSSLSLTEAFSGSLGDTGGMIAFRQEGRYVLTATAGNGSVHSAEVTVGLRGK